MTAVASRSLPLYAPKPKTPETPSFARRYRPKPGHPDFVRLEAEAKEAAARILPTLEKRSRLHDARRRARSLATAAQSYVENRRRARVGREDLLPLYFIWTTHRTCNYRCSYCDDHRGHRYPELPDDDALDTEGALRLLRVMRTRCPSVYLAGGEPTLRKDLPTLARRARELDYYPIILNTNGSALGRQLELPEWRDFLACIDVIVVSLDALDLETLSRMWGTSKPEEPLRTLLVLRELAAPLNFKLSVNCVVQPDTIDQASDVLDLADDLGVWFSPVPMNVRAAADSALVDDPSYRALAERILERKRDGQRINGSSRMNRRLLFSAPLECRNALKPHVDADGSLYWPCKSSINVEPLRVPVLEFDHLDDLWAHATARIDPRGFHGPAPNQCGGNCNWAQNYTTDAYAHGLGNPLSLLGEVRDFLARA